MSTDDGLGALHTAELQHLKRVSRIKHVILQNYLRPWASILGSRHRQLAYFDCFARPGGYELEGKPVAGSPAIAVKESIEFLTGRPDQSLVIYLIDDNPTQVEQLEANLKLLRPYPQNLNVNVHCADSRSYVPLLRQECFHAHKSLPPTIARRRTPGIVLSVHAPMHLETEI